MDNTNDLNFKEEVTNDKGSIKVESPFDHTGDIVINDENENNNKIVAVNPVKINEPPKNNNINQTDTLDESIAVTLKRDLFRIYTKLRYVVIPKFNRIDDAIVNLELKNREYLEDIKNTILIEIAFIISRSIRFRWQELQAKIATTAIRIFKWTSKTSK